MCCSKGNSKCKGSEDRELRHLWGTESHRLRGQSEVNRQGTQRRAGGTAVPEKGLQITAGSLLPIAPAY